MRKHSHNTNKNKTKKPHKSPRRGIAKIIEALDGSNFIDQLALIPMQVKRDTEIANSFFKKGLFFDFVKKMDDLAKDAIVQSPSFRRLASPGEKRVFAKSFARLLETVALLLTPV